MGEEGSATNLSAKFANKLKKCYFFWRNVLYCLIIIAIFGLMELPDFGFLNGSLGEALNLVQYKRGKIDD
ncbi:MAG: hypothetical protein FWC26_07620 [Fibromonadales bacterium]|nr:hypothetical protein [Fibromonadales bacterium]